MPFLKRNFKTIQKEHNLKHSRPHITIDTKVILMVFLLKKLIKILILIFELIHFHTRHTKCTLMEITKRFSHCENRTKPNFITNSYRNILNKDYLQQLMNWGLLIKKIFKLQIKFNI